MIKPILQAISFAYNFKAYQRRSKILSGFSDYLTKFYK